MVATVGVRSVEVRSVVPVGCVAVGSAARRRCASALCASTFPARPGNAEKFVGLRVIPLRRGGTGLRPGIGVAFGDGDSTTISGNSIAPDRGVDAAGVADGVTVGDAAAGAATKSGGV